MSATDGVLVGRVAVRLEGRDERLEPGRQDNEVGGRGDVRERGLPAGMKTLLPGPAVSVRSEYWKVNSPSRMCQASLSEWWTWSVASRCRAIRG